MLGRLGGAIMLNEMQQRTLRYLELAHDIDDDRASEMVMRLATECDDKAQVPVTSKVKLFDEI
jgi:hypothetical protein